MNATMIKRILFLLLVLLILNVQAFSDIDLGGYYRSDLIYIQNNNIWNPINNLNRLRLKFDYKPNDTVLFHLEPQYIAMSGFKDFPVEGASDLKKITIERAYISLNYPSFELITGKQRIAWGTAYMINPTDVFNPFSLTLTDEEKQSVESIRGIYHIGYASSIDMVIVSSSIEAERKWAIRGKTNISLYDLSLSYVYLGKEQGHMVGTDFSGELMDLGVRGEFAAFTPWEDDPYMDFSIGSSYTFDNGVGIDCEYYNNGRGKSKSSKYDYISLLSGDITFLARHYLYLTSNYMINEIESVNGVLIWNLIDGGLLVYPSYTYNIMENVDLSFEAILYSTSSGSEWNFPDNIDPDGITGSNMYFIRLRYSF